MTTFNDAAAAAFVRQVGQGVKGRMPQEMPNVPSGMAVVVLLGDTMYCLEDPKDYDVVKEMFGNSVTAELFAVDWSHFNQAT
jgi:hypothetical protein